MANLSTKELERRFVKALEGLDGAFDVEDITERVKQGTLQSWQKGQSVVITEVLGFPRKRVINVLIAVGNLKEVMALQDEVMQWGRELGCSKIMMRGRKGWDRVLPKHGWTNGQCVFELDLETTP